ncbi:MAG: T9SS type A sorting domain-containing protein [Bacteroidota bacterium]|jgi:hypothetical protein
MRKLYTKILFLPTLFFTAQLQAQTIASDSAGNTAYAGGWSNGTNGGNGFNAWVINAGNSTGVFIGNPANDGMGTTGIGTTAFGIYATGTAYLNATRSFVSALKIGDELSFYWAMNWDAGAGTKGFDIRSGSSTVFNINNGNASPKITSSAETALFEYGTKPMLVTLKRTSSDIYSFSMTGRADGENYSTTINTALPVDGISFYIGNQNDGNGNRNIYFNNFKIVSTTSSVSDLKYVKGFAVYPNPVSSGSSLQLELVNRAPGKYTISLFNVAGLRVQQAIVGHAGGTAVQSFQLSSVLSPGMYIAEIIGNGKKENLKLMVK